MVAMEEEHRKKGREGLFFNHHQLGLATKEVTRLAAVVVVVRGSFPSPLLYGPSTLWYTNKVRGKQVRSSRIRRAYSRVLTSLKLVLL